MRLVLNTVVGLLLAAATLYVGAYLALASTPGRALLAGIVEDTLGRGNLRASVGSAHWGPAPGALWAARIRVELPIASIDVALWSGARGCPDFAPERVEVLVDKATIRLPEPGEGPPPGSDLAKGGDGGGRKNRLSIPDVRVAVKELDFTGAGLVAHARDVDLRAVVGDAMSFDVTTGPCHFGWANGRRVTGFDRCRVERANVRGKEVDLGALVLERDGDMVARIVGHATLDAKKPLLHAEADLDLASWDAAALAGDQLPEGLVAEGVVVDIDGDLVRGHVGALTAARYHNGPFDAELVAVEIPAFTGAPGLILPQVTVTLSGLAAAHAAAFDWSVEGVSAPWMVFDLEKKLEGSLIGVRIDRWTTPSGAIDDVASDADLAIGLSGGSVSGLVTTPDGVLDASGHLKKSPITKRATFTAEAAFADLRGPLAALVLHDVSEAQKKALGEPLSGSLSLAVDVTHEERFDPYELELEWDTTELRGKTGLSWDGSDWVEPEQATPDEPDAPEPK
ncbi:MAG: hypothetical protein U1F43_28520 [Myxococcota bacterium]